MGTLAWELWLGNFSLGSLAWDLRLGMSEAWGTGLLRLGEPAAGAGGTRGAGGHDRVIKMSLRTLLAKAS